MKNSCWMKSKQSTVGLFCDKKLVKNIRQAHEVTTIMVDDG
jgi:hypothetical protein